MKQWVCQKDKTHVFNDYDPNPAHPYYCPMHKDLSGFLKYQEVTPPPTPVPQPSPAEEKQQYTPDETEEEVGLSVILMDASSSMTDPAFEGIPITG